jgi:hypothetical protein
MAPVMAPRAALMAARAAVTPRAVARAVGALLVCMALKVLAEEPSILKLSQGKGPVVILRMNVGMSMPVGQAMMHGASKQKRQRFASIRASCGERGGFGSTMFKAAVAASIRGWIGMVALLSSRLQG